MTAGVLLILASALLHASWNALLKREVDKQPAAIGVLLACGACAVALALRDTAPFPDGPALAWGLIAGFFEAFYFVTLTRALAQAPLGLAYTVARGGAMLMVWPISALLLAERLLPVSLAGVVLVGAGLWLTNGAARAAAAKLGWSWACAGIAGYHLAYGRALAHHAQPASLFALSMAISVPVNLALLGRGWRKPFAILRARPIAIIGMGVLACASFSLFLVGLTASGAGAGITLRNTSVAFALLFGLLLGERPTIRQWAGAALVVGGATLVALA